MFKEQLPELSLKDQLSTSDGEGATFLRNIFVSSPELEQKLDKCNNSDEIEALVLFFGEQSIQKLLSSVTELKKIDGDLFEETFSTIFNLVKNGMVDSESFESLVGSISFSPEINPETTEKYGQTGPASWKNFSIEFHSKILEKDSQGNPKYNIGQIFCHEISHSIYELADTGNPEDLPVYEILEISNIQYESAYIQKCVDLKMNQELLDKERMADLTGFYLSSVSSDDGQHFKNFIEQRICGMSESQCNKMFGSSKEESVKNSQDENNQSLQNFFQESRLIFETIKANWDSLKHNQEEESDIDRNNLLFQEGITTANNVPSDSELGGTFMANNQKLETVFPETAELGRKNEKSQNKSFIALTKDLLASFASEIPNVN